MGRVTATEHRRVALHFDLAGEERVYASEQAPLTRVRFNPGDQINTRSQLALVVNAVSEKDGIFVYHGSYLGTNTAVIETELDPHIRFSRPEDRLFTRQIDDNRWFDLRYRSRQCLAQLAESPSRGLYGPRVSLIPHQLYIASEVASRFAPRVLLADEVGLGKTIEAGLIIHQQLQTGRAARILVMVPPALIFQWFVEMIRRFNLPFTVMDEARCKQIMADNMSEQSEQDSEGVANTEGFNPFEAQQLMLCSLDLFTRNPERLEQALDSEWDLLVVDEAHHLAWSPEAPSLEYRVVELIATRSMGLLLLTATPEQLGRAGHFARLRLLDPDRFHDYDQFVTEEETFEQVANAANQLLSGTEHEKSSARAQIRERLKWTGDATDAQLIASLLDRHGTGRVLFRNIRASIKGFPERVPLPAPLPLPESYLAANSTRLYPELDHPHWTTIDPRVPWLIGLIDDRPADKFLVICAHREVAFALEKHLRERTAIRSTLFHEDMDLIARDRAAAYFSESEKGAQVLIASEIGSEGRNFQFASNLVLFDLPLGPDLLEQRIGRLDRIGQARDVHIYIPFLQGTAGEDLYRWYEEGVNAFSEPNPVAQALFNEQRLDEQWLDEQRDKTSPIDAMLETTRALNVTRRAALNRGRDRLLELNSHRSEVSAAIVADIQANEGGSLLEEYMELSFDAWGLESEPITDKVLLIKPTERMVRHFSTSLETLGHFYYPEVPEDGIRITYDRATALAREDVAFFTWENPTVQQALDIVVTDVTGNSAMIVVKHPRLPAGTLLVEVMHLVDCVAPRELGVERYLPPRVLRSVITPNLNDIAEDLPYSDLTEHQLDIDTATLHKLLDTQMDGIRKMLARARMYASEALDVQRTSAYRRAEMDYDQEIARQTALREVNRAIRREEIRHLALARSASLAAINDVQVRLDAIRVIVAA